jgi:hypothetical protein
MTIHPTLHVPKVRKEHCMQVISLKELVGNAGRSDIKQMNVAQVAIDHKVIIINLIRDLRWLLLQQALQIQMLSKITKEEVNDLALMVPVRIVIKWVFMRISVSVKCVINVIQLQMALASGNTPMPTPLMNQTDHFGLMVLESCQAVDFLASSYDNKDVWIANTGASNHTTCNDVGILNGIDINVDIKVGDGNFIKAIKMGSKHVSVSQQCYKTFCHF